MSTDSSVKCRYCADEVTKGETHHCSQMRERHIAERTADEDDGDFFISLAVATATDSWLLGTLVGGSLLGAVVGDLLDF